MKPRVLLLTPFPPFPPDNGGVLRIYSIVRRLKEHCDFSLLTFVRRTGERRFQQHASAMALRSLFSEVHSVPKESTDSSHPPPGLPQIAREWYSDEMAVLLRRLAAEGRMDIVHIEFLQMASYVDAAGGVPTFLTEHDLSHLSLFRSYFREWTGLRRWGQVGEWLRTRRYHGAICRRFDRLIALTPEDRGRLAQVVPPEKVSLVQTCVDLERFQFRPEEEGTPRPADMAYVGHYPHYPNEDAALWLCRKVLPRVRARAPAASVLLIGSAPTEPVLRLAGPGVEVTGTVPDIRAHLDRAKVFAAPVRLGFGIKGKVLEAFARGLPVVATTVVARGIPEFRPGMDLLVGDTPAAFARQVLRLLEDPGLRRRMAASAREKVVRHYDWRGSCDKLLALYRVAAGTRVPEASPQ
ncbi:MAG: hypothetical protein A2X36_04260 [Elusimicrobia bacterium GWA2_69_24]|nr:MAG: hypothetical protein A2X36_04260 [Elusimicrobia bacterium GWA2_69_24]